MHATPTTETAAPWPQPRPFVIGMLHLLALPGSPGYSGDRHAIRERILRDGDALVSGGVHALLIENFGDAPFFPRRVPAHVVAAITELAGSVRRRFDVPLGVNVLRNDGLSAMSIAHAVGASFIRVNVLGGARVTDQGVLQGIAHRLLRLRANLDARQIRILADVDVKHSGPLGYPRPLEDEVADTVQRCGADGVIASGHGTGKPTSVETLRKVCYAARPAPVFVGSGVTAENAAEYAAFADGLIVGTNLKEGGLTTHPVDASRVRLLMANLAGA